jgi:class 3 adenylate cyclase/TolB-like protein/Tfp pilus assembly protein PilF
MFTDLVGYSTLMNQDESLGYTLLHEHRQTIRPFIEMFRGLEIDTAGDGFVVKFASALEAVRCGLAIQKSFAIRNQESEHPIKLRIGIHVSDILVSDSAETKGIYGDGVNIAARLQPQSPIGGLCVSGAVYEQIAEKTEGFVTYQGSKQLKGIKRPMRLYSIAISPPTYRAKIADRFQRYRTWTISVGIAAIFLFSINLYQNKTKLNPDVNRLAILPFDTRGFTDSDIFLADGISGKLINLLSQRGISVIAQNSVAVVKKLNKSPREIGEDLNVSKVITGTVEKIEGKFRIQLTAINTENQTQLWSEQFEKSESELVQLQASIEAFLLNKFQKQRGLASIEPSTKEMGTPEINRDAYTAVLKGQFFMAKRTPENYKKATEEFNRALSIDANFAQAYAGLALTSSLETWYGFKPPVTGVIEVNKYATKALELNPALTDALLVLAETKSYLENSPTEAEEFYKRAINSNSQSAIAHQWFAEFLVYRKRFGESFREAQLASELDPLNPVSLVAKGSMHYFNREFDQAITIYSKALDLESNHVLAHYWIGRSLLEKHEYAKSMVHFTKALELSPDDAMIQTALAINYAKAGNLLKANKIISVLEQKEKTTFISPYFLSKAFLAAGLKSKSLEFLKKSIENRIPQVTAVQVDPDFDDIRNQPEFQSLVSTLK